MSKTSEAVKRWRKRTKKRIVESMGGECQCCGYNKCLSALTLHHLEPGEKDFSMGGIRANCKSWHKIVIELRKCVLVCNNCHAEIHDKIISIPLFAKRFDESFISYENFAMKPREERECFACGKTYYCRVDSNRKFCCHSCSCKYNSKVDWDEIDLIEMKYAGKSNVDIAKELDITETAVRKRLKRLNFK